MTEPSQGHGNEPAMASSGHGGPARVAPPTVPGVIGVHRPAASWPKKLGVVLVVVGSLATLGAAVSIVANLVVPTLVRGLAPGASMPHMSDSMRDWRYASVGVEGLKLVAGIWCIVAGTGLKGRRPWGPPTARWWAVSKILIGVLAAGVGYLALREQMAQFAKNPQAPAIARPFMAATGVFGVVVQVLWLGALPTFVLIWLARRPVRELIATWGPRPVPAA